MFRDLRQEIKREVGIGLLELDHRTRAKHLSPREIGYLKKPLS